MSRTASIALGLAVLTATGLALRAEESVTAAGNDGSATASSAAPSAVGGAPAAAPAPDGWDAIPLAWLPPGSAHSLHPSEEIFPPQSITLRFDHALHIDRVGLSCKTCHADALTSERADDRLLPAPTTCDACHGTDHSDILRVSGNEEPDGQCGFCHVGDAPGKDGRVAPFVMPEPNLKFSHKAHVDRNVGCPQCHGQVDKIGLATRDQLPRMAGCFQCHNQSGPAQGEARGECTTCHLEEPSGILRTTFATGELTPPRWLYGSNHGPDFITRHAKVAADRSSYCGSCHREEECLDCHNGKVRPRNVHPNDWISMHASAAVLDNPRCTSCHQVTTFCGDCHRRLGIARDSPIGNLAGAGRFHPPPGIWTDAPRSSGHHAWEAMRNINACVSCHTERDCATCHAVRGLGGGQGISPHPAGFSSSCSVPFSRNPRPCFVCHGSEDPTLDRCL